MRVYGKNVFYELINSPSKIKKIYLSKNINDDIFKKIKENNLFYEIMDNNKLNRLIPGNNQGIIMEINDYVYSDLTKLLEYDKLIILDHLTDPHNFGAIIRTCEALGIKGIIIPKNRSVLVNETVMKVSSGALEYVDICLVSNVVQTIIKIQKEGYFVYGTDMNGTDYRNIDYPLKTAIVIGNEGEGISDLTRKSCDEIVSIPMSGKINSLNASVAAAIIISEVVK